MDSLWDAMDGPWDAVAGPREGMKSVMRLCFSDHSQHLTNLQIVPGIKWTVRGCSGGISTEYQTSTI